MDQLVGIPEDWERVRAQLDSLPSVEPDDVVHFEDFLIDEVAEYESSKDEEWSHLIQKVINKVCSD
ncbi:MAG: hypothetical protein ACMG6E_09705 [Candidatus Roizmanbacteria bacterium]